MRYPVIKRILGFLGVGVGVGLTTALYIIGDGLTDEAQRADLAVILGNQVTADGRPSLRLRARLDRAVMVYQNGSCDYLLVSGGVGREGVDEAVVMKTYLVEQGIPESVVFVDSQGFNTYLTARHTAELMEQHEFESVIAVSQFFHITRSKVALRQQGIETVAGAHAHFFEVRDFYATAREVVALYVYLVRY